MNPLLRELEVFYLTNYGASDIDPDELTGPREALLTVSCDGQAAGIVGVKERSATVAELVRLWVPRAHRAHNHGRELIQTAMSHARSLGYERMTAVTDIRHPTALVLGSTLGAHPIEPYGPYASTATTRCIEVDLTTGTP